MGSQEGARPGAFFLDVVQDLGLTLGRPLWHTSKRRERERERARMSIWKPNMPGDAHLVNLLGLVVPSPRIHFFDILTPAHAISELATTLPRRPEIEPSGYPAAFGSANTFAFLETEPKQNQAGQSWNSSPGFNGSHFTVTLSSQAPQLGALCQTGFHMRFALCSLENICCARSRTLLFLYLTPEKDPCVCVCAFLLIFQGPALAPQVSARVAFLGSWLL